MTTFWPIIIAIGICSSLAVFVVSSVVLIAACVGLIVARGNSETQRQFLRMGLFSLLTVLVAGPIFWWISEGATVPLSRY